MNSDFATNLLRTVHLLFIFAGAGAIIAKYFLLRKFREATSNEAETSERMALVLTRFLEVYGLLLALITGLVVAWRTGAFSGQGYLHVKTLLVVVLIGFGHMELRTLKRMAVARAEGNSAEAARLKQTHLAFVTFDLILLAAIVILVEFKPF